MSDNHQPEPLSVRDYFIGQAIAGILANPVIRPTPKYARVWDTAQVAIRVADAVLQLKNYQKDSDGYKIKETADGAFIVAHYGFQAGDQTFATKDLARAFIVARREA